MHGSVTGIDISDDYLTAVQVTKGMGGWEIRACARIPLRGEAPFDDALSMLSRSMNLQGGECVVALPEADTYYRNLTVPFKDKRKQREILSFELEPNVPFPIDDLIIDFLSINTPAAPELLAFFVEKRVIDGFLESLGSRGIDPDALCVRLVPLALWLTNRPGAPQNGMLLELGEKRITLVLWQEKKVAFIRTVVYGSESRNGSEGNPWENDSPVAFHTAMNTIRHTVHAFGARRKGFAAPEKAFLTGPGATISGAIGFVTESLGIPALKIELSKDDHIHLGENAETKWNASLMNGALSLALGWYTGTKGLGLNFRRNEFEIRKQSIFRSAMFKKIAVWLAIIAALWAVDMGTDIHFLKQRANALDGRIRALFKKTFPHISRIVDPVKQAQIEINELKRAATPGEMGRMNGRALDLLLEISERLPATMDLKVSRLVIDPYAVRIKGSTDTYNTVDRAKQGLEKSSLFKTTTISSANLDRGKNRVLFEIKLGR
ncbi:putative general secretion pathway protein L [delta proteobacterium NaphS2]|nr:putative general secretion pathway protein L [delta proteobacterium NaphS2]